MITRRSLLTSAAMTVGASAVLGKADDQGMKPKSPLTIGPYEWKGLYADHRMRSKQPNKQLHDWRLCAELKGSWLGACERIILRTSEIIGYETGFLYDDHFPPSEPEGRGKNYRHIPFEWQIVHPGKELYADCAVPGKGKFSLRLTVQNDYLDIQLTARNDMEQPMENLDWAFCAVTLESSLADSEATRTYLFDGKNLRTIAEIAGRDMHLYKVAGANGFIPVGHRALAIAPVEAMASVVIIEAEDGAHSAAIGFEQADHIYAESKGNKCFHADPYFGPLLKPGEEKKMLGRFYMVEGNAAEALRRYRQDFSS